MAKEELRAYEEQLKPCPFCGRKATIYQDELGFNLISCHNTDCPIEPYSQNKDIDQAVKNWNTRLSENKPGYNSISDILDKIKGYVDHIRNTGMGKKKSLDFIEKYIEGLKAESKDKE